MCLPQFLKFPCEGLVLQCPCIFPDVTFDHIDFMTHLCCSISRTATLDRRCFMKISLDVVVPQKYQSLWTSTNFVGSCRDYLLHTCFIVSWCKLVQTCTSAKCRKLSNLFLQVFNASLYSSLPSRHSTGLLTVALLVGSVTTWCCSY